MHPTVTLLRRLFVALCLGAVAVSAPSVAAQAAGPGPTPTHQRAAAATGDCQHGSYVWSGHLGSCGWSGPGNTGSRTWACPNGMVNKGTDTTHIYPITTRNKVISCQNITGCLRIFAQGVTVKDVHIRCTSGKTGEAANGSSVISTETGASATLSHVTINGMRGVHACVWHMGTSISINKLNCRNVNDGVFSWSTPGDASDTSGNNFSITNSYFHDFTTRTANGHIDGYQTEGAAHGVIKHNTYLMTADNGNDTDSAIAIWDGNRSSSDIVVQGNLIAGGGFSIYAHDYSPSGDHPAGGYSVTDTHFVDNVFSKRLYGCVGKFGVWFTRGQPTDGWHRTGNTVLETGVNIDTKNPSVNGQLCT